LLENDIDVHEPVAQDRIGPGNGHQDQRQHRELHEAVGHDPQHVRDDVNDRKRQNAENSPIAQPLQLSADDRILGSAELECEVPSAQQICRTEEREPEPV
jgi:hypothetical protein